MPSIDERIVAMAFENRVFEQRVAVTMTTLGKLDASIRNLSSAKGLEDIEKSANKVTLQNPLNAIGKLKAGFAGIGDGVSHGFGLISSAAEKLHFGGAHKAVDSLQNKLGGLNSGNTFQKIEAESDKVHFGGLAKAIDQAAGGFSVLEGAASVAFGNIASQAAMKGVAFGKSFALGPITDGLHEYETNMKSIQTILSNTDGQKISGLENVNKYLEELNVYSDQTIYNFAEMAKNIGRFTAAGVDLPKATSSIKGIANLAALSGSSSEQAARAMEQLSQAIATGKVGLQDWKSVETAGMGGAVFQKSLIRSAEAMGTLKGATIEMDKATGQAKVNGESFRQSISAKPGKDSWLTSEVLTSTLSQLTGDLKDAELAAMGFDESQIKAIQRQAKVAKAAATEVKTLGQVWDVARETIGSGWAQSFKLVFGDFNEAKKTFTGMSNFVNDWINKVSAARNAMLEGWSNLGGRMELLAGLRELFLNVRGWIIPVITAFKEIFPPHSGRDLFEFTKKFHEFAKSLNTTDTFAEGIIRTFKGVFAVFHTARAVLGGVIGVIFDLLAVVAKATGSQSGADAGFVGFTARIGDMLVAFDKAATSGEALKKFFEGLTTVLKIPLNLFLALIRVIGGLFTGNKDDAAKGLNDSLDSVNEHLGPLKTVIDVVTKAWDKFIDVMGRVKTALDPMITTIVDKLSGVGDLLVEAFKNMDFDNIMNALQAGFIGGIFVMLKKSLGGDGLMGELKGSIGGLSEVFGGLTGNLEVMQKKIQAQTIATIAAAIALLAASAFVLSKIDGKDLSKALVAMAVGLGELMGAMKLMMLGMGKMGFAVFPFIAAGLIGIATAVLILAGAMKIFSTFSWEEIGKGLAGVAGSIAAIGVALKAMGPPGALAVQAGGLILMGIALNIIAAAMKIFGSMKLEEIGKGVFTLMTALGGIALGLSTMPPSTMAAAATLVVVGIALAAIGRSIAFMGTLDLLTIVKGLGAMMAAIAGIGLAISLIPPHVALSALALLVVGQAMIVTAAAISILGKMSVGGLIKGIVGLAGVLVVLALGLTLMIAAAPGAVALLAVSAALAVLVPVLAVLGSMKWASIFKGMAAMALVLGLIAVGGILAAPALTALGIALLPLGLGFLLVAKAAQIFVSAVATLSSDGQKGVAVFLAAITGFALLIPTLFIKIIEGLLGGIEEMAQIAPKVVEALAKILATVIQFVHDQAVPLAMAFGLLIDGALLVIVENTPKFLAAGYQLIMSLLSGLSQNIGSVTNKVSEVIVKFLEALRNNMPKLIEAGSLTLRKFLDGVGSRFGEIAKSVGSLIVKFTQAVGNQASKIQAAAAIMMGKFVAAVVTAGPALLLAATEAMTKFMEGVAQKGPDLIKRGVIVAGKLIQGIANGLVGLAEMGFKAIIDFLNGLAEVIRTNSEPLVAAGVNLGSAILEGLVKGFGIHGRLVRSALESLFKAMPGWVKKILGIKSPSKVFEEIGMNTAKGFAVGIKDNRSEVEDSFLGVAQSSMKGLAAGVEANKGEPAKAFMTAGAAMVAEMQSAFGTQRAGQPSEIFRDLGKSVNDGFKSGLLGSKEDLLSAFDSLNDSLIDKIRDLRTQVKDGNQQLGDLQKQYAEKLAEIADMRSKKKPDKDAIADAIKESETLAAQIREETVAVNQNGKALAASRDIRRSLTGSMQDEKKAMLSLKRDMEDITAQLQKAEQVLSDMKADEKKWTDQYAIKPDFDTGLDAALADADLTYAEREEKRRKDQEAAEKRARIDQVALYKKALEEQLVATAKYEITLQKLRELGLDDETYRKLLDKGLSGSEFAEQLLRQGKPAIDKINEMDAKILAKSTDLAKQATKALYDAGVQTAQGLVDGLKSKQAELKSAMESLADMMVQSIRKKLQIKSPSRIFMEVGQYTLKGLAQGLQDTSGVEAAVVNLGRAMTDAISSVSEDMDASPVITPVLDLTQVQKDAKQLDSLSSTNVIPITAAASYGQATSASTEVSATQQAALEAAATAQPSVEFTQNNYSPEALNDVEIYRKTKNQIGLLKQSLGVPA